MKKLLVLLLVVILSFNIQAQEKLNQRNEETIELPIDSTSVLTIDSTIKTLYSVISGEKGEKRNWKQFKFLFKSEAKIIPSGIDPEGIKTVRYMSPQDYIKNSENWLIAHGFIEREIHRTVNTFGNIAQVFSTYESLHSESNTKPFMRGINSIQLFNDGKRWWIINLYWTQESEINPIPKEFLP